MICWDACVFLMNNYSGDETVNLGTGKELTIKELTDLVAKMIGYTGEIKVGSEQSRTEHRESFSMSANWRASAGNTRRSLRTAFVLHMKIS